MATTSRLATLLVRIQGDADGLEGELDGGLARAESSVQRAGDRIRTASSAIGAGVGAGLAAGITQSLETEAAGDKLAAQLGASGDRAAELGRIQGDVYASGWGDSLDTVGVAIKGVQQNIGDLGEGAEGGLEGIASKALMVSETFDQDLSMTTAAVGNLLRNGLADDADEAFDIITAGLQGSGDKAGDLLETFNEYAPLFARVGVDGQTMTGLISQGLQGGARDADQVADAIGIFGETALKGGTAVEEAFSSIGLNADEMSAKIGQGGPAAQQALQMTMDALRGTSDQQTKLNAAAALFGDPANTLGAALYALDPATAAASAGMDNIAGRTDAAMTTISDSPAAALETFKRISMQKLGEIAGGFVTFGMANQGVLQPLLIALGVLAGAILAARVGMAAWTAVQTAWRVATAVGTAAQWAFNAAMSANPLTLVALLVVALTAGIVALYMKSETARTIINGAFSGIWSAMQFVYNWVRDNWPLLLGILTGPIGMAVLAV